MGKWISEEEFEEVYGLAETCVEKYRAYAQECDGIVQIQVDTTGSREPSASAMRKLDAALAELGDSAQRLKGKLTPIRRAFHRHSLGRVKLMDLTAATHVEVVLKLCVREGSREPWTGRLDPDSNAQGRILGHMSMLPIQEQERSYFAEFEADLIKTDLDIEAGRVIGSVSGEFDHVARMLYGQPRLFFDLLVERQGQTVSHEAIAERVIDKPDAKPGTIYRARNRLKNALIKAGFGELDDRIESIEGGYCLT